MDDIYRNLPFDDVDGGVWKQGWDVQYDAHNFVERPLNVYMVMHSHVDPGWIKTFEDYYQTLTKGIISNTLNLVKENQGAKFVFAEMSYFHRWWSEQDEKKKMEVRELLQQGRYEIVTGGWVMNDEANVHYTGAIMQLSEGHNFLMHELDYKPKHGWAIDPFGHSPVMAYVLKLTGFEKIIINRVHYAIKKELALNQALEFRWRQQWETEDSNSDILASMLPFFSYDIPHTCGPDPSVCSLFEFFKKRTAWKGKVEPINDNNIKRLAELYVDQFKKKSVLFRTGNNVLVMVGDDFTYSTRPLNEVMYFNQKKLHEYINSHPELNTNIKFATLGEYFDAIQNEAQHQVGQRKSWDSFFPVLQGDFFTYADRENYYWSGYYTSRSYLKSYINNLLALIKAAEISHTWYRYSIPSEKRDILDNYKGNYYFNTLQQARRDFSLLQHHDGITGTAKDFVVNDYGNMVHRSYWNLKSIISTMLSLLSNTTTLESDTVQNDFRSPINPKIVSLNEGSVSVVLYNSLHIRRTEVHSILSDESDITILDSEGDVVRCQISPYYDINLHLDSNLFRVYFEVEIPPMGYNTYIVQKGTNEENIIPQVFSTNEHTFLGNPALELNGDFSVENEYLTVKFSSDGKISSVNSGTKENKIDEDFMHYSVKGGAYLFEPIGGASSVADINPQIRVIKGELVQEVYTQINTFQGHRRAVLFNSENYEGSYLKSEIKILHEKDDTEAIMRFNTDIKSEHTLYSDLNGLYHKKSQLRSDRPIPFNYYPITTSTFIQDKDTRFSVLVKQGHGCASLKEGQLEVMLDRRTTKDDNRGLQQHMKDNREHTISFMLVHEDTPEQFAPNEMKFHTSNTNWLVQCHNNPIETFYTSDKVYKMKNSFVQNQKLLNRPDVNFFSVRTRDPLMYEDEIIIQASRVYVDDSNTKHDVSFTIADLFRFNEQIFSVEEMSATLLDTLGLFKDNTLEIEPMDIKTIKVTINNDVEKLNLDERGSRDYTPIAFEPKQHPKFRYKEQEQFTRSSSCETNLTFVCFVYLFAFLMFALIIKRKKNTMVLILSVVVFTTFLQVLLFMPC
eukprot:TRINITY_DN1167_c0_g4_i1.p1 TRINITY_DN1167_c0_g4~~TRINITY_DN1167_c0_g4_i1.p1  ORF type:complete len:1103 (+),score=202.57 TRINITY_DN1167_c0_g4_i1:94-3309(+)